MIHYRDKIDHALLSELLEESLCWSLEAQFSYRREEILNRVSCLKLLKAGLCLILEQELQTQQQLGWDLSVKQIELVLGLCEKRMPFP